MQLTFLGFPGLQLWDTNPPGPCRDSALGAICSSLNPGGDDSETVWGFFQEQQEVQVSPRYLRSEEIDPERLNWETTLREMRLLAIFSSALTLPQRLLFPHWEDKHFITHPWLRMKLDRLFPISNVSYSNRGVSCLCRARHGSRASAFLEESISLLGWHTSELPSPPLLLKAAKSIRHTSLPAGF